VIFGKVAGVVAAIAAIAAAAAICMVALSFAAYAGLREVIGPAWAAAAVAGIVALLALIIAFFLTRKARPKPLKGEPPSLTAKLLEFARERPVLAGGAAIAAAAATITVAIKNPRILSAIVAGLLAPRPPPPKR
jgi:uncharacterized membrane protein